MYARKEEGLPSLLHYGRFVKFLLETRSCNYAVNLGIGTLLRFDLCWVCLTSGNISMGASAFHCCSEFLREDYREGKNLLYSLGFHSNDFAAEIHE